MLDGFKKFILRGSVVDMAVGVVMGAAFGAVVTELTKAFLTPLIALIVGKPDYSKLSFAVRGTVFPVGEFVNADRGLGYLIVTSTAFFRVPLAWGALVLLSLLGIVLFQIVVIVEQVFFPWAVDADRQVV